MNVYFIILAKYFCSLIACFNPLLLSPLKICVCVIVYCHMCQKRKLYTLVVYFISCI